jgi:SAM-dependent methyltransferase
MNLTLTDPRARINMPMSQLAEERYTNLLISLEARWLSRIYQRLFRWHIRSLKLGFTLDVGCGIGRNLMHLDGNGIGIDISLSSLAVCRARGLTAFTPEEFERSVYNRRNRFDSLLFAHICEHMSQRQAAELVARYTSLVKGSGKLVLITPQEAGFRKYPEDHVEFMDHAALRHTELSAGFTPRIDYSFPLPAFGNILRSNEFVLIASRQ